MKPALSSLASRRPSRIPLPLFSAPLSRFLLPPPYSPMHISFSLACLPLRSPSPSLHALTAWSIHESAGARQLALFPGPLQNKAKRLRSSRTSKIPVASTPSDPSPPPPAPLPLSPPPPVLVLFLLCSLRSLLLTT